MKTVPSFEKDHVVLSRSVPYFMDRPHLKISNTNLEIRKIDLRFMKPNTTKLLPIEAMHSIEHLMAQALYEMYPDSIIDFSPMACQTGFYLSYLTRRGYTLDLVPVVDYASRSHLVPTPNEHNCGNYRSHNEELAKEILSWYSKNVKNWDEVN